MTVKGRTESRWRFKRPPATHNLLIHFVHRADRFQYYDSAALCSAGRGLCGLSTALRIHWTLWAPSNRISGKISQKRIPPCRCPYSGTIVPKPSFGCANARWPPNGGCLSHHRRGGRWLTYSFQCHGYTNFQLVLRRSGSPQKPSSRPYSGALPGLRSNAQMGLQHAWIGPVLESRAPRRRSGSTLCAAGRAAAVTIVPTAIQNLTAPPRNGGRDRQLY